MNRRSWLRAVGSVAIGGLAGCGSVSESVSGTGPQERNLLEFGQYAPSEGIRATTTGVRLYELVAYEDPSDGSRTVWNPAGDGGIAVASFVAVKRTFEKVSWPSPARFQLRTSVGTFERREQTPDGTSVYEITWPTAGLVSKPAMSGGEGVIRREWESLFLVDSHSPDRLVTTWVTPNPPYYWMKP